MALLKTFPGYTGSALKEMTGLEIRVSLTNFARSPSKCQDWIKVENRRRRRCGVRRKRTGGSSDEKANRIALGDHRRREASKL
jgi:hypothetical protein